jgi:YVTN family beta-propeller protein
MNLRNLGLLGLTLLPVLLFLRMPLSLGRTAEPDKPPAYKNPLDVTVDKEGKTARVVLAGTRTIVVVDLAAGKVTEEMRWPKNMADPDDTPSYEPVWWFGWMVDLNELYNIRRIFGDGKDMSFAVHQQPKFNLSATQVAQGWVFTNSLTLRYEKVDTEKKNSKSILMTAALDEPQRGYADPADVIRAKDGLAFVACAGADTVLAVDPKEFEKHGRSWRPIASPYGKRPESRRSDTVEDLTASRHFINAKLPTQANPRRLGLSGDGKTLVVSNYLADSLTVIDTEKLKVVKHISLGGPAPNAARRGEILFNSGKMTFQGAFTCASCHPNGEADGLNWDLTRDGIGNFKNTKSLLGVRDTAPYGWEGRSATLEDRVTGTLRTLHQHEPASTEVEDLVAYLKSLPPPKPEPVAEKDKPAVERGAALFQGKARCATCHKGAALDDSKSHDVGTRGDTDTVDAFDTPSLRGVGRTAPYLHDGRAATLEEIFTTHNPKKRHGAVHLLAEDELKDLIAYLKSL